jgi:hypothetical protein
MPRAGLTALATMMSAFPGAQQNVQTALATKEERSMRNTRFGQEQDQYKLIKDTMLKDEKWIDNLYDWVRKHPTYSKYADLLPDRKLYSNDMKGKESANGEVAKLKYMADKYEQAKQTNPNFSVTPNLAYDRKDWQNLYSNALAPTMKPGQAASEYAAGAQEQGGPEGATSEMARQNIGVLQNQEALASKASSGLSSDEYRQAMLNLAQGRFGMSKTEQDEDFDTKYTKALADEEKAKRDKRELDYNYKKQQNALSKQKEADLKAANEGSGSKTAKQIEDKYAEDLMAMKTKYDADAKGMEGTRAALQTQKERFKKRQKEVEKTQAERDKAANPLGLNLPKR